MPRRSAPEENQDRDKCSDVAGHVERETEPLGVPAEERLHQNEVRRAGNRQKLSDALNGAENGCGGEIHEQNLGSSPCYARALRRPSAGAATAALRALRALRMMATDDGDEDGGVGSGDDAHDHRERKAPQHGAAKNEQREHRDERGAGGDDRPAQRLVDRTIDDRF